MPWTNPLDRLPQLPQADANHVVYGGVGGFALTLILCGHMPSLEAARWAAIAMFALAAVKKTVDYFKEAEPLSMCVYKALITAAWPASVLAALSIAARHA